MNPVPPRAVITELVAVRHGESTANAAFATADAAGREATGLPERDSEVPLTELGREQSAQLRTELAGFYGLGAAGGAGASRTGGTGGPGGGPDLVLSSPYLRARETARLALDGLGFPAVQTDQRLRDRDTGVLELLNEVAIRERFPGEYQRRATEGAYRYRPPGGESLQDVTARVRGLLADLGWSGQPPAPTGPFEAGRALVFAHDAVIVGLGAILESGEEATVEGETGVPDASSGDGSQPAPGTDATGRAIPQVPHASLNVWSARLRRVQ